MMKIETKSHPSSVIKTLTSEHIVEHIKTPTKS
jgi:hypothetical protein